MSNKKTSKLNIKSLNELAQDKPVVYKILNIKGENIYTGSAKKGRVTDRIIEHLKGNRDAIPGGTKATIKQHNSIHDALESELRIISRTKPKHNKKGK